jgi:hypothetical protein
MTDPNIRTGFAISILGTSDTSSPQQGHGEVAPEQVMLAALIEIRDHWANQYDHPRKSGPMYAGPYGIGVTDGHRACAIIAERALFRAAWSASPAISAPTIAVTILAGLSATASSVRTTGRRWTLGTWPRCLTEMILSAPPQIWK